MANETKITAEPGKHDYFIVREFDAPRELVFRAFTDPELVTKWLGPHDLKMTIEKFESKDGGSYRYNHEDQNGNKYFFRGVNHESASSARLSLKDCQNEVMLRYRPGSFEALPGGRTRFTSQSVFQSVADRDGMLRSGMERGVKQGFERLDEVLATLQQAESAANV